MSESTMLIVAVWAAFGVFAVYNMVQNYRATREYERSSRATLHDTFGVQAERAREENLHRFVREVQNADLD